jgi:hypothetical protein
MNEEEHNGPSDRFMILIRHLDDWLTGVTLTDVIEGSLSFEDCNKELWRTLLASL